MACDLRDAQADYSQPELQYLQLAFLSTTDAAEVSHYHHLSLAIQVLWFVHGISPFRDPYFPAEYPMWAHNLPCSLSLVRVALSPVVGVPCRAAWL